MSKNEKSFEVSLSELEQIVEKLDKGELTLDESVKLFKMGMDLSAICTKKLDETEKKITVLIEDSTGNIKEEKFLNE